MKPKIRPLLALALPLSAFCVVQLAASTVRAQVDVVTPTTIYSFPKGGANGEEPVGPLVQANDGNFYGTTYTGLPASQGTIYRITAGGDFTVLYAFGKSSTGDAQSPNQGLVQARDGTLYGVTLNGGASTRTGGNNGAIYKATLSGTESVIYSFGVSDKSVAGQALLLASDGNFYGPAYLPGVAAYIYKLTPGGAPTVFYTFTELESLNELIQGKDGNLYGVTSRGRVFRLTLDGTMTTLCTIPLGTFGAVNSGFIQGSDGNFYGTSDSGGDNRAGAIYKVTPDGVPTILYNFTAGNDGSYPNRLMQASDGNFYGTTAFKDFNSPFYGTIFQITPGGKFTTLYHFPSVVTNGSGKDPESALIQGIDGNLYGTTTGGGTGDQGVIYRLALAPGTGTHLPFFTGEAALANGVYYLQFPNGTPFGYYSYLADPHYIFHQDLGYEYVFDAGDGRNGVFLYDFKSGGFFYTSPSFPFPYLYDFSLNAVLYYFPDPKNPGRYNTDGVRYFSNLTTGQIISK